MAIVHSIAMCCAQHLTVTQTWAEAVTFRISCPGHIPYKSRPNYLQLYIIITHSMGMCNTQRLATNFGLILA